VDYPEGNNIGCRGGAPMSPSPRAAGGSGKGYL